MDDFSHLGFRNVDVLIQHDAFSGHDIKMSVKNNSCLLDINDREYKELLEAIKQRSEKEYKDIGFMYEALITYNPDDKRFNSGILMKIMLKTNLFGTKAKELFFHLPEEKIREIISKVYDVEFSHVA